MDVQIMGESVDDKKKADELKDNEEVDQLYMEFQIKQI